MYNSIDRFPDENDIHYLQEFSGRRGIHIWILFEEMITKELGYDIVNTILNQIPELKDGVDNEKWGLRADSPGCKEQVLQI